MLAPALIPTIIQDIPAGRLETARRRPAAAFARACAPCRRRVQPLSSLSACSLPSLLPRPAASVIARGGHERVGTRSHLLLVHPLRPPCIVRLARRRPPPALFSLASLCRCRGRATQRPSQRAPRSRWGAAQAGAAWASLGEEWGGRSPG
jgi:hypothetical protein